MTDSPEFNRWQARFAEPGYLFGTAPNAFLKAHAHLLRKGETALAIADGEGRNGAFLAEQGLEVLSVDYSPVAQEKARALARASKSVPTAEGDQVLDFPYEEKFSWMGCKVAVETFCTCSANSLAWPVTLSNCARTYAVLFSTTSANDFACSNSP